MNLRRTAILAAWALFSGTAAPSARAASSTIGILVFDGFLTSDVTAPLEVLGAAGKRPWFAGHEIVLVSAVHQKAARSEEGLRVVADRTIYDDLKLDVLIVPSAYKMQPLLKNKDLVDFIRKQGASAAWMASNSQGMIYQQLKKHGPFLLHHYCGSFWYGPGVPVPTTGGHTVLVVGTDTDRGSVWFNNPWGTPNVITTTASIVGAIVRWETNPANMSISYM